MTGRLDVVGIGIDPWRDTSERTKQLISSADEVPYLVADPLAIQWVERLNENAASLAGIYAQHPEPLDKYEAIVDSVIQPLREGSHVCFVLYGHPGVFAIPGHDAVTRARDEGFDATMHPAVSAADCLYADLGVDPGRHGCLSFEASQFLRRRPAFESSVSLLLWQVGVVGAQLPESSESPPGLRELVQVLIATYGADHETTVYEAATQPTAKPRITTVPLSELPEVSLSLASTLYVPPATSESTSPAS